MAAWFWIGVTYAAAVGYWLLLLSREAAAHGRRLDAITEAKRYGPRGEADEE